MCRQSAGQERGPSPRNTLTRTPLPRLEWGHEILVFGFGNAQKQRFHEEGPRPYPAP